MPIYYVYILRCIDKKGTPSYYTGSTQDLLIRVSQHQKGTGARYTHGRNLELMYFETHTTRSQAMKREYEIKTFTASKKQQLIDEFQKRIAESKKQNEISLKKESL
jgi:putative endonuclease